MLVRFLRSYASQFFGHSHRAKLSPPEVVRKNGSWHSVDLEWIAGLVQDIPGDFAEIGVFRGKAFKTLIRQAIRQHKTAHAFDSFLGMDEPSPEDGAQYPKGRFSIGGAKMFVELMNSAGLSAHTYRIWAGYIPNCFTSVPMEQRFSLVMIDVDHYKPTVASLAWACPRINRGGILAVDDFLPDSERYATKAIKEFLQQDRDFEQLAHFNQQLILRKK